MMKQGSLTPLKAIRLYSFYIANDVRGLYDEAMRIRALAPDVFWFEGAPTKTLNQINEAVKRHTSFGILELPTSLELLSGLDRSDQLKAGLKEEKINARSPKAGIVHVKSANGEPVFIGGRAQPVLRWGAHMPFDCIDFISHTSVVVIENWQAFERIDDCSLNLGPVGDRPLFVYRGDDRIHTKAHLLLCERATRVAPLMPIIAYVDIDPAGVSIANAIPGLSHFVMPALDQIPIGLSSSGRFEEQLRAPTMGDNWRPSSFACIDAWDIILKHQLAVQQEVFIQ